MRMIQLTVAVAMIAVSFAVGLFYSTPQAEAQATRQVEVKRVKMTAEQVTTQTLGVVTGISCLDSSTGVECFVVSSR
ncbi:MAG TPA: hypothetical protein VFX89_09540 [Gammaproteobacteria bacterium]|nr:hypothetical protein [Gammaproteobacteria bacterium]